MKKAILFLVLSMIVSTQVWGDDNTPLCFTARNGRVDVSFEIKNINHTILYSTDSMNWDIYISTAQITIDADESVYFLADANQTVAFAFGKELESESSRFHFSSSNGGTVEGSGNIMSLYGPDCPDLPLQTYAFSWLFDSCTILTTAPSLPATTLESYCYQYMFYRCISLTAAPSLPATTLVNGCYQYMFFCCTSLTTAPSLPAMTLGESCYYYMFSNCTSLTAAPSLPATSLTNSCYQYMFFGCTSLIVAPSLPATTLAEKCYHSMFSNCSSLAAAPSLPATSLARFCYTWMFSGCKSLTTLPLLPASTLVDYCYRYMFNDCISLVVDKQNPGLRWSINATNNATDALTGMFLGTSGTMHGTPSVNTTYYLSQHVDTFQTDVYYYCGKVIDSVTVTEFHLIFFKSGGQDTADIYFSNDTSFVMSKLPRVIEIIDSVTGNTTTVTITINSVASAPELNEVLIHITNLEVLSVYYLSLFALGESDTILTDYECCLIPTTVGVDECVADNNDFFPTEETDVYLMDGRYVGKYSEGLPRGVYVMREGRRCWKMAVSH